MERVILILITNKPKEYFTENPELSFLTRSMRIHRIYEMGNNLKDDNINMFNKFVKIFGIKNEISIDNINFDDIKISDMYSAFNFANGDFNIVLRNLKYMNLIKKNVD